MGSSDMSKEGGDVLAYLHQDGCLLLEGKYWDALYRLLPPAPDGSRPPPPIILAGAHLSNDKEKHDRLVEHIIWADEHGAIDRVGDYLFNLQPTEYIRITL